MLYIFSHSKQCKSGQSLRTVHNRYEESKMSKKKKKTRQKKQPSDDSFNKGKRCGATKFMARQIFLFRLIFQGIIHFSMKAFNMLMKLCT